MTEKRSRPFEPHNLHESRKCIFSYWSMFGLSACCYHLSRRSMLIMVTDAEEQTGLGRLDTPVRVTPHVLGFTYTYMLHKATVNTEVQPEISSHFIKTAMKYGRLNIREKELTSELLKKMITAQL